MTIFTMGNLYRAYQQCIKNKKHTTNALKFEMHRERNLVRLLGDLQSGRYRISRHICFVVTEPAPREIFASDFRDRIVQHLLCNEIGEIFEQQFSDNSYANRVEMGTHRAFKKARFFITRGGKDRQRLHYLKMDIKSFFRSIHKETLWNIMCREIHTQRKPELWKTEVAALCKKIIFHNPAENYLFKGKAGTRKLVRSEKSLLHGDTNRGLPIGNITSQLFANIYLHSMDGFIERDLGICRYVRYVDDFILFHEDREYLERCVPHIENFILNQLSLKACQDKTIISSVGQGVDLLGYYIKPTHTLVRRKVVKRFKKKLFDEQKNFSVSRVSESFSDALTSYHGHFVHAYSYNLVNMITMRIFLAHLLITQKSKQEL